MTFWICFINRTLLKRIFIIKIKWALLLLNKLISSLISVWSSLSKLIEPFLTDVLILVSYARSESTVISFVINIKKFSSLTALSKLRLTLLSYLGHSSLLSSVCLSFICFETQIRLSIGGESFMITKKSEDSPDLKICPELRSTPSFNRRNLYKTIHLKISLLASFPDRLPYRRL